MFESSQFRQEKIFRKLFLQYGWTCYGSFDKTISFQSQKKIDYRISAKSSVHARFPWLSWINQIQWGDSNRDRREYKIFN